MSNIKNMKSENLKKRNYIDVLHHDNMTLQTHNIYVSRIKYKERHEKDQIVIHAYTTHLMQAIRKLEELFDKEEEIIQFRDYLIGIGMYGSQHIIYATREALICAFNWFCKEDLFTLPIIYSKLLKKMSDTNFHEERKKLFSAYEIYLSEIYKWGNIITDYIVQCKNIPIYRFNEQKNLVLSSKENTIKELKESIGNNDINVSYVDGKSYVRIPQREYKEKFKINTILGIEYGDFIENEPFGYWVPRVAYRFIDEPLYEPKEAPDPSIPVEEIRRRTRTK